MNKYNISTTAIGTASLLLMFLSFFKVLESPALIFIGDSFLLGALYSVFLVSMFQIKKNPFIDKNVLITLSPLLAISLIYIINTFFSPNPLVSLQRGITILLISTSFLFFYRIGQADYDQNLKRKLTFLLAIIASLMFMSYASNPALQNVKLFFLNPNAFGMYISLLFICLIVLINRKWHLIIFPIGLLLIYVSSSRTALLAYLLAFLFLYIGEYVIKRKLLYSIVGFLIIASAIVIIYMMSYLDIVEYNELVRHYSRKNLLSGRNDIWPYVLTLINQKPYLGWGGGTGLGGVSGFNFSTHNFYLNTALQIGYIGVVLVFLFYTLLWNHLRKNIEKTRNYNVAANALLIWLAIIQNFEVTLLQNNLAMSAPILCLIAYILGSRSKIIRVKSFK